MTHDEIVDVIKEKFPGLSPINPFNRRVVKGRTSFWIAEMNSEKDARVVRIENKRPWNLKRVASEHRENKKNEIRTRDFDHEFLGTPSELVALVREEIEILRTKAHELNITLPANFEVTESLLDDAEVISEMSQLVEALQEEIFDPSDEQSGKTYIARSGASRAGQASFREKLIECYGGKCCISSCTIKNILEAAHIVPFNGESTNSVSNGLLLRSDLHTLFDLGLLRIDPETYKVLLHATVLADSEYKKFTVEPLLHLKGKASKPALEAHFKSVAKM